MDTLKLTESSIESITQNDSLAHFLADASELQLRPGYGSVGGLMIHEHKEKFLAWGSFPSLEPVDRENFAVSFLIVMIVVLQSSATSSIFFL